jgi:hypothetical protein
VQDFVNNFHKLYAEAGQFRNEAVLCDWLSMYMRLLCRDVLFIDYHSHSREYLIDSMKSRGKVDFVIYSTDKKVYLLECKYPSSSNVIKALQGAIGQILTYKALAENVGMKVERAYLFTTEYDNIIDQVITQNRLPITVILAKGQVKTLS